MTPVFVWQFLAEKTLGSAVLAANCCIFIAVATIIVVMELLMQRILMQNTTNHRCTFAVRTVAHCI